MKPNVTQVYPKIELNAHAIMTKMIARRRESEPGYKIDDFMHEKAREFDISPYSLRNWVFSHCSWRGKEELLVKIFGAETFSVKWIPVSSKKKLK